MNKMTKRETAVVVGMVKAEVLVREQQVRLIEAILSDKSIGSVEARAEMFRRAEWAKGEMVALRRIIRKLEAR